MAILWNTKTSGGQASSESGYFTISGNAYFVGGEVAFNTMTNATWVYETSGDSWAQKQNYPFTANRAPLSFAIGNKGYVGGGYSNTTGSVKLDGFYEYNPDDNTWTSKANLNHTNGAPVGLGFATKGYMLGGNWGAPENAETDQSWEYTPSPTNSWTQKVNVSGFTVNGTGTVPDNSTVGYFKVCGILSFHNQFYKYDTVENSVTTLAEYTGLTTKSPISFCLGTFIYCGMGLTEFNTPTDEIFVYNMGTNVWTQTTSFPLSKTGARGFHVDGVGYIAKGQDGLSSGYVNSIYFATLLDLLSGFGFSRSRKFERRDSIRETV